MATLHEPTILAPYRRAAEPSMARTGAVLGVKLALAAAYGALVVLVPPAALPLIAVPIVVALLLVLWMLPDRAVFPYATIEGTLWVFLVCAFAWPSYLAIVLPGLPWLTPTRVALFALMFFLIYSVSTSSNLRANLLGVARSTKSIWIMLGLWQAMQFVTIPFSDNLSLTMSRLFNNALGLTGIFFVACLVFLKAGRATTAIRILTGFAIIWSFEGFLEWRLEQPPWADHIPSFMRVDEQLLGSILSSQARAADGLYRVRGPFPVSLIFAEFLAIALIFILHWIVVARTAVARGLLMAAWLLVVGAILITQSRLGLVAAMAGHFVYLPLWAIRRRQRDKTSIVGPSFLLGVPILILIFLGLVLASNTLSTRVFGGGAQAASDQSRRIQREMAIPHVLANPVGHGLGQSGYVLQFRSPNGMVTVDNHYITTVLDLGVVGLVSFYGMWLAAAWAAIRLFLTTERRETLLAGPLAAVFLAFVIGKSVLSQENNHWLLFLFLGMLAALKAREMNLVDLRVVGDAAPAIDADPSPGSSR